MSTDIRAAGAADIPSVLELWRTSATPTSTDSPGDLRRLLHHDPGALLVAEVEGEIVGSVIAGWDGWRGSVYRLVVDPAHHRRGLGGRLLRQAERRLAELEVRRMHAIVVGDDARAVSFWASTDWELQGGQLRFAKG